jgi:AcrR family transcriptional regulator
VAANSRPRKKEDIIRAAFHAISEKGYSTVTLQDIADKAGTSKGILSYYFETKEDLFLHLLQWLTDRIHAREAKAVLGESDAIAMIHAYIYAAFAGPIENRVFYRVYLDFLAQGSRDARFREVNQNFYHSCWDLGKSIIQAGVEQGLFEVVVVDDASRAIRSMIDGCLIQWVMSDDDALHEYYRTLCEQYILNFLMAPIQSQHSHSSSIAASSREQIE